MSPRAFPLPAMEADFTQSRRLPEPVTFSFCLFRQYERFRLVIEPFSRLHLPAQERGVGGLSSIVIIPRRLVAYQGKFH